MTEPAITPDLVKQHGLTTEEFAKIKAILGREPNYTELGIFSVMWSEHCSYKNTRPLLKTFPTRSPKILVGAGEENAGIVDIGRGLAIAFKIESHNHPSAVEPFQGAATGVGGIVRDIFTMGARPVCAVNSLRFGPITEPAGSSELDPSAPADPSKVKNQKSRILANRRLFSGVVGGIAHYGNCFGIPTVAGEIYFDPSYEGNPLVNAFCLGVLRHGQIARGAAQGTGNPVFYVGPATGRDGLAGAAFASQDLTDESAEQQRGAVQVGDPFMEKLVCEACLELLDTGAVAGMQDMGAAGLTCSTCETAARAGTGIEIDLAKVPQRAPGMTPYEIMLSESQERMLIIVRQGREEEVKRIFDKWDLPWSEIGTVTDTGRMVIKHHGRVVADIPARTLTNEAPVYHREAQEPAYLNTTRGFTLDATADCTDPRPALASLLAWPTIASKNWVYRQYDHMVRNGSAVCPGSDAAVLRLKHDSIPVQTQEGDLMPGIGDSRGGTRDSGTETREAHHESRITNHESPVTHPESPITNPPSRVTHPASPAAPENIEVYLAISVDCNAAYVYLDPFEGGKIAVAECARNLACSGARPLGVTDNLNSGNPHNPETFWQLREAVRGLAEGCRVFNAPVTGGNVSLYNQNPTGAIDPTPTVAMVGLIDRAEHITTQWFKDEGDAILLLGETVDAADPLQGLGGSAYLQVLHGRKTGTPPRCDLTREKELHEALISLIHSGDIKSAHDCSEGGLAVALAEACISRQAARETPVLIGAEVVFEETKSARLDALLFGETQGRVVVTVSKHNAVKVVERAKLLGTAATRIGTVGGSSLKINVGDQSWEWPVAELHDRWWHSIARAMSAEA